MVSAADDVGRAGRDGQPSHCELLATLSDVVVLQNFIYADTPEPNSIKFLVDFVFKNENFLDVSFYELSRLYDLKSVVLETLFTYLELEDVIEPVSTYYFEYDILLTKLQKGEFDQIYTHLRIIIIGWFN